jgi:hypothetical protein
MRFHVLNDPPPADGPLVGIGVPLSQGGHQISLQGGFEICGSNGDGPRRCRVLDVEIDCNPTISSSISRLNLFFVDLDGVGASRQLTKVAIQSERMFEGDAG